MNKGSEIIDSCGFGLQLFSTTLSSLPFFFTGHLISESARQPEETPTPVNVRALRKAAADSLRRVKKEHVSVLLFAQKEKVRLRAGDKVYGKSCEYCVIALI